MKPVISLDKFKFSRSWPVGTKFYGRIWSVLRAAKSKFGTQSRFADKYCKYCLSGPLWSKFSR